MEIVNEPGFALGWMPGEIRTRGPSAAFAVKGTFRLRPDGRADSAETQDPLAGDVHFEEEPEHSLRYEADLCLFKPRADLLLNGTCHAPGGKPLPLCTVRFQVGKFEKSLSVIGDRVWKRSLLVPVMSDPLPFTTLPIRYERAFGGAGYPRNPTGKGYRGEVLPNLEDPGRLLRSPEDERLPAGFGPIPRSWPQRSSKSGTYKGKWLKERWPWLPDDFDWSYFNAAPEDQQMDGYLRGDEELAFDNLHPRLPFYRSRLPGIRCRLFVEEKSFREVALVLDTLWVDPGEEKLILVWRGVSPVLDLKLKGVRSIYVVSEPLAGPSQTVAHYQALFPVRLKEEEGEEPEEAEEPEPPEEIEDPAAEAAEAKAMDDELAELTKEEKGYQEQLAKHIESVKAELVKAGKDPSIVDAAPRDLAPGELTSIYKAYVAEVTAHAPEVAAKLPPIQEIEKADRDFAEMDKVEPEEKEEEEPAPWTRESCRAHAAGGGHFDEQDLGGLDLSELDWSGVSFAETILKGANLRNAKLVKSDLGSADLSGADLSDADLTEARLKEADVTGAKLDRAKLVGAMLELADFSGTSLIAADLTGASAPYADFSKANLSGSRLRGGAFADADFCESVLEKCDFTRANLSGADLDGVKAKEVLMEEADLTGFSAAEGADLERGDFRKARAQNSAWTGSKLDDADFSGASLDRAIFNEAAMNRAKFVAAGLKHALLAEASLVEADLSRVNLFRGSFEKSNLTRADLRGANLYEVEFYETVLQDAKLEGANVKGTKLAGA